MASQSLYRKWRSQTFGDLVGQEPVIRTLKNALNSGTLAHAYLFTGPRGTGKTSTARLLAKTINCLHPQNSEPCNVCEQCREITAGNSFNVIEIDAASNRGIDSIRELREKVMMPPSTGKYKIYILDEAHMLTTEAFNALLKTLEEPPPHAIFVMATTDVHKMLPTVLSRCQRFDFKRITTRQIVEHLHFVAQQEGVQLERGAAELIARAAAGGMRDALSLLDQAIAYAGQEIVLTQVQAMLGVSDPRAIQKCMAFIADLDSSGGLHLINALAEAGADLRQLNLQIAEYWRAMMLSRAGADIATIIDSTEDEVREIVQVAQRFALEELTECARIFAQNDLIQKSQGTPQLGLELALLNCIEIHRRGPATPHIPAQVPTGSAPARPVPLRPASGNQSNFHPQQAHTSAQPEAKPAIPVVKEQIVSVETQIMATAAILEEEHIPSLPAVETMPGSLLLNSEETENTEDLPDWDSLTYNEDEEDDSLVAPVEQAEPRKEPPATQIKQAEILPVLPAPLPSIDSGPTLSVQDVKEKWEYVKRRVKTKKDGAKIAALLNGYVVEQIGGTKEVPVVVLRAMAPFHYSSLQKTEHHEAIEWALKIELQLECRVRLLAPGNGISLPTATESSNLANTMMTISTLQSAFRERPEQQTPPSISPVVAPERPRNQLASVQAHPVEAKGSRASAPQPSSPSLARTAVVSENTTVVASAKTETHQQSIEKKAKSDPVVKEVIRLFKAEIKDIQPK